MIRVDDPGRFVSARVRRSAIPREIGYFPGEFRSFPGAFRSFHGDVGAPGGTIRRVADILGAACAPTARLALGAMSPHRRAMIAAAAHAFVTGKKVAGVYDHAAARHLRIAAEAQGEHLQGLDGDRAAKFGGTIPELYDAGDRAFVSIEIDGTTARGYDRASASAYTAIANDRLVQLYDHGQSAWFAFDIHVA
jgi:hypothetical protein